MTVEGSDDLMFSGHIGYDDPPFPEKMNALKQLKYIKDDENKISVATENMPDVLVSFHNIGSKYVKEVDLTHLPSQKKITSFDQLQSYNFYTTLISELGGVMVNGSELGND